MSELSCWSRAGEPDLLFRDVPVRTHEADQPGRRRGWGSWRLFPRVPRHAGGVALSQGQRDGYVLSEPFGSPIIAHSSDKAACLWPVWCSSSATRHISSTTDSKRVSLCSHSAFDKIAAVYVCVNKLKCTWGLVIVASQTNSAGRRVRTTFRLFICWTGS